MKMYSSVGVKRTMFAALVAAGALAKLSAQPTPTTAEVTSPTTAPTPVKLESYTVTGSYIPAAADEAKALPVQVIDAAAIQQSGVNSSVLDVLRKTIPQIEGGANVGLENANTGGAANNGGSQVSLRNIDTLVLIDGKRVAPDAVAAGGESGGGGQFVDLNIIPISAVERIEVLTDGASAIYGTDAVSGVINIIMRKDYDGAEVDMHMSMAPNDTGGYQRERSVSAVAGAGNANTQLTFSAEWTKQQPLWERDLSADNPFFGTSSYPGVLNDALGNFYRLAPGLNAPPATTPTTLANLVAAGVYVPVASTAVASGFNLALKPTELNALDKRIATLAGEHKVSDTITLKGDFLYAFTETNYQLNPQPVTTSSGTVLGAPGDPLTDTTVTVRNRFIFGPNRIYDNQSNFYRGTAELDGKVNDYFNWMVGANYNLSLQTAYGFNQILNSALQTALKNGNINLFAIQQNPTNLAAANIFGTSVGSYRSQLYTYNAMANGKIVDLPGGPIQYAGGVEYRKESLLGTADYNSTIPPGGTSSLWNNGTSLSPFNNQRNVKSEFAELKVPITDPQNNIPGLYTLSVDGAVRHEAYSDNNKTTVPKFSIRYLPINDQVAFRATYAKSFGAPTLYSLYGPSSAGSTPSLGGITSYNSSGQAIGVFPNLQGFQLNGFNPNLTPTKATSKTAGIILSPRFAKGLEITVDYYKIDQTNLVGSPGSVSTIVGSVEQLGPASPFANLVAIGGYPGQGGTLVTGPGQLHTNPANVYVLENLTNIAGQRQHGFDVNVKYTFPWEQYGRFVFNTDWSVLRQFFVQSGPTDPGTDYSGFTSGPVVNGEGTLPKVRSYSTLNWDLKAVGATLGYTNIHHVDDINTGQWIPPYNTFDIQGRVNLGEVVGALKGISFDAGIDNFTNQRAPVDRSFSTPPFDAGTYSMFGRIYYADLKIKF
jgi:iron complex outermembrane receptor protein